MKFAKFKKKLITVVIKRLKLISKLQLVIRFVKISLKLHLRRDILPFFNPEVNEEVVNTFILYLQRRM